MHDADNEGDWGKRCEIPLGAYSVFEIWWTQLFSKEGVASDLGGQILGGPFVLLLVEAF